ncbi:MAG: AraC family transcriptional regulator [Verrucomicrobiaceae bacterium]|nr:MAG: AraC family transcriptional regulator [Verrucomicrobiaceae bacterium]
MPASAENYFVYLPEPAKPPPWDCVAISAGRTRVPAGSRYPAQRHPMDHHFNWADGRILHSYSIIYIVEGAGVFESAASPRKLRIEAGAMILLFPEVWHRYAPDPAIGWVEHWIECRGSAFDRARKTRLINPAKPVLHAGPDPDVLIGFERCHAWARRPTPSRQAALSTMALHLLALAGRAGATRQSPPQRIDEVIQRAQMLIAERCQENLSMQKLAHELHVGYSHFRQAFRERTGTGPKQFHARARLQKAREFLANTSKSVKEIAEILGFHSAFHFSNQFKSREGVSPLLWRERLWKKPRAARGSANGIQRMG